MNPVARGIFVPLYAGALVACAPESQCDKPRVIDEVQRLTLSKLRGNQNLIDSGIRAVVDGGYAQVAVESIRDRGTIGKAGSRCAATLKVGATLGYGASLNAEYLVEPTTDGKLTSL